jgi:hypothetical protein
MRYKLAALFAQFAAMFSITFHTAVVQIQIGLNPFFPAKE